MKETGSALKKAIQGKKRALDFENAEKIPGRELRETMIYQRYRSIKKFKNAVEDVFLSFHKSQQSFLNLELLDGSDFFSGSIGLNRDLAYRKLNSTRSKSWCK